MVEPEIISMLEKYKKLLSRHMYIEQLILYGSYAKGNACNDSDVDVAVVVDKISGDFFSTRPLLWRLRREIDDRIEPVLVENSHDESGFLAEILKNGVAI